MDNKYRYIISLFNRIYGLKKEDYQISYGLDNSSKIQIKRGKTGYFDMQEKYDLKNVIWKEWQTVKIPFLFDENPDQKILTFSENTAIINFDIIASSFYFLSNWQEKDFDKKNGLCRFPFEESIQYKLNIIEIPVVNYYFDILKQAIAQTYHLTLKSSLWLGKSFCTFISHDIDTCETAWMQGGYRALRKGDIITTGKLLFKKISGKDGWFNFDAILAQEKKDNIQSSFFFLGRKGKYGLFRNADYNIKEAKFKDVFKKIKDNNSEVGIHGSLGSCNDGSGYNEEIQKFGFQIRGNRFHFLEFDSQHTIDVLEKAGIEFDSTMGFAEHYGFRNGICFPFYLYDIRKDKPSGILEIPLILMDGTLQNSKYMNLGKEEINERIDKLIREIKKINGLFTVLWHNTHYSDYKYRGWKNIIEHIISRCKENDALFLNGSGIKKIYGDNL
jgi:hypothetical protein